MTLSVSQWIISILLMLLAVVMIIVVLFQQSDDDGLSGAIAGGAETFFGKNKGRTMEGFLVKFTTGLVVMFFVLAILLNMHLF